MKIIKKLWQLLTTTGVAILILLAAYFVLVVVMVLAAIQFSMACTHTLVEYYKTIIFNKEE